MATSRWWTPSLTRGRRAVKHYRGRVPGPSKRSAVLVVVLLLGLLGGVLLMVPLDRTGTSVAEDRGMQPGLPGVGNVVLILADDLDWDTFRAVPRLAALQEEGTTFTRFGVAGSLCCPSRVSIFRSQYLHNHQVVSNGPPDGGWPQFRDRGETQDCLPVWLHGAGVRTAMVGKYLNTFPLGNVETYIPAGWDHWAVPVSGHKALGYDYTLSVDGRLEVHGSKPADFLGDVLQADAVDFLATVDGPFFLEVAPYTPHSPFGAAARNVGTHAGETAPRGPSFDQADLAAEPPFLQRLPRLDRVEQARIDLLWRKRLESSESVADLVTAVRSQLQATGHDDDTLVIVTSDNGFHLGQHRLRPGKQTAFDEDVLVPTVLLGPGVPAGLVVDALASEVDLAPTIAAVLQTPVPTWADGTSLVPWLSGRPTPWRDALLAEHLASAPPKDPDHEDDWQPPNYAAMRTRDYLYVEYVTGARQLYDLVRDPAQMHNLAAVASPELLARLHDSLQALSHCAGAGCRVPFQLTTGLPALSG